MSETERESGARADPDRANRSTKRWAVDRTEIARRRAILTTAVESEVIPRLLLSNGAAKRPEPACDPGEIAAFTALLLASRLDEAGARLAAMRQAGTSIETIYLDVLAPIARQLGTMWDEDLCDFGQVTVGLGQLRRWLVDYSNDFQNEGVAADPERRILLVPAPGEQHSFGLTMVTEFFRHGGWTAWSGRPDDTAALIEIVSREWFAVIGFSVAVGLHLQELTACIRQVRGASRNGAIGVMVGGPLFIIQPELVTQVGADATAADGLAAVRQAQLLLSVGRSADVASARASVAGRRRSGQAG